VSRAPYEGWRQAHPSPPPSFARELLAELRAMSKREMFWSFVFGVEMVVIVVFLLAMGPRG
jgi:hypothetical protein